MVKKEKTSWNAIRAKLDRTLDAYASIIDIEEKDELSHLGNDIISIIRNVYYNKNVEA